MTNDDGHYAPSDAALDWLMDWALAQDQEASAHYWHICDGIADSCGCQYEGEGTND